MASSAASGGVSLPTVLTLIFVVLKLVGVITWSWWWVLSPIWIALAIGIPFVAIVLILAYLAGKQ
jgi:hypothetical protein